MHNRRERERGCYHEGHCGKVLPHSMKVLVAGGLHLSSVDAALYLNVFGTLISLGGSFLFVCMAARTSFDKTWSRWSSIRHFLDVERIRLLGLVNKAGRVLLPRTLDIVEAGEESVKGARRTIRRVSVVRDCSLLYRA
jgi:hypothetical protein